MTRDQLQQIRDALEHSSPFNVQWRTAKKEALAILDAELAKPEPEPEPEPEPVAKVVLTETLGLPTMQWLDLNRQFDFKGGEFLYAGPPAAEPWVSLETVYDTIIAWDTGGKRSRRDLARRMVALFNAPVREWQSLTDEEINQCAGAEIYPSTWAMAFADAISDALRAKNTGEQA